MDVPSATSGCDSVGECNRWGRKGNEASGHSSLDGAGALIKEAARSVSVRLARHFGFLPSPK